MFQTKQMSFNEIAKTLDMDKDSLLYFILAYGSPEMIADSDNKILDKIEMTAEIWEMIAKALASVIILDMQFKPGKLETYNK